MCPIGFSDFINSLVGLLTILFALNTSGASNVEINCVQVEGAPETESFLATVVAQGVAYEAVSKTKGRYAQVSRTTFLLIDFAS